MKKIENIKENLSQIFAISEKNIKLKLRFKYSVIVSFIAPVITIIMPIIVMSFIFSTREGFGPWSINNFMIYQFIAYNLVLLKAIIIEFPKQFRQEKFWKTFPALIIGPFNRFNLLLGIFLSELLFLSIPLMIFFVLCYIYAPISLITALSVLFVYFLIALIFSGIGIISGIFVVSNENIWRILTFLINLIFLISCISYPFELFPNIVQGVIVLNPLYHIFDLLRYLWLENNVIITLTTHTLQFVILIITAIILPCIGVYTFNIIYKKFGIVGY